MILEIWTNGWEGILKLMFFWYKQWNLSKDIFNKLIYWDSPLVISMQIPDLCELFFHTVSMYTLIITL